MTRLRADLVLLTTAVLWGATFVVQKQANATVGPLMFVGLRFGLGALVVAPFARAEQSRASRPFSRGDWALAGLMGLCLFTGSVLQQLGLETASATDGGFLTALYVVIAPFIVWMLAGGPPRPTVLVACLVSAFGAWLLAGAGRVGGAPVGDALLVAGDIAWALAIAVAPILLRRAPRPMLVSLIQNAITGALGVAAALAFEPDSWTGVLAGGPQILFAGVVSSGVAYTLQVVGQAHAPAAEAALILSLESVFAALAGAAWLGERLTWIETSGCALILLSVAIVEWRPAGRAS